MKLFLACALMATGMGCTRLVREADLFHGRQGEISKAGTDAADLVVPLPQGGALRGRFLTSHQGRSILIHFYGNGQAVAQIEPQLRWMAETFDVDVVCLDYRGYGISDGRPTLIDVREDAVRIFDHLTRLHPGVQIIASGFSLGTAPAIHLAASRLVAGVLLQAPISSPQDVIPAWSHFAPWYSRPFVRMKPAPDLAILHPTPLEEIRVVRAPLAIVHGTVDRLVPIASGRKLYEAAGSRRKIWKEIPGADHNDLDLAGPGPLQACQSLFWAIRAGH